MILSVEKLVISVADTVTTGSANLTLGQTLANCVPYASWTHAATDAREDEYLLDIFLESGPDRVSVSRTTGVDAIDVTIYLVEYDPGEVTVQSGTFSMTADDAADVIAISSVTTTKAFPVIYVEGLKYDTPRIWVSPTFSASDELTITRGTASSTLNGTWYLVEHTGPGAGFTVQAYSREDLGDITLASPVDVDKTFVLGYLSTANDCRAPEYNPRIWLEDADTVTCNIDQFRSVTFRVYVVEFGSGSSGRVQRGSVSFPSEDVSEVDTLTTVDLDYASAHRPCLMQGGVAPGASTAYGRQKPMLEITSSTEIEVTLGTSLAYTAEAVWEVVEWPAPSGDSMAIYLMGAAF